MYGNGIVASQGSLFPYLPIDLLGGIHLAGTLHEQFEDVVFDGRQGNGFSVQGDFLGAVIQFHAADDISCRSRSSAAQLHIAAQLRTDTGRHLYGIKRFCDVIVRSGVQAEDLVGKAICTVCGQAYGGFAAHSLTKTEAKAATYTETGNNEYYTCSVCQKVFKDAAGTQETTVEAETIAKLTRPSSGGSSSHGDRDPSYAVTAPSTKNGDVTVSPKNASKGDRVTITVTSDKGYELDKLIVKDASGNKLKLTDKGNGKYTFTMPGSKVTVSAEFVEEQAASIFADVPADAYYAKAVEWAVKKGITNGKANGLFGSNDSCTRAQIVTFLWRAAGSPAPKGTAKVPADVLPGSYCYDAVAWALENGIINGLADGTFGVNNTCTRGQSVTFLYRAMGTAPTTVNGFTDVAADSFCADAVAWAVENGVTNGTSATTFSPNNGCTRAQIVTFLYRAYQGK